jgi:hypothetical protein
MKISVTKSEWQDWCNHPVTQEFAMRLRDSKQDTLEAWGGEMFNGDVENATALGGVRVLNELISSIDSGMEGYA